MHNPDWHEVDPEDGADVWSLCDHLDSKRPAYARKDGRAILYRVDPGDDDSSDPERSWAVYVDGDEGGRFDDQEDAVEFADQYIDDEGPEQVYPVYDEDD